MTKKMYLNKKCNWCLKNWYDGRNYITKACDFHQEYSYDKYLAKLKKDKRELKTQRIEFCFQVMFCFLVLVFGIVSVVDAKGDEYWGWVWIAIGLTFLVTSVWIQKSIENDYKKFIKKDLEKLKEWGNFKLLN